jgi:hypothetical protein
MINRKLGRGQPYEGYREVNRITVVRIGECLAQRSGAAVVWVGDRDDGCRPVSLSRDFLCGCEWNYAHDE